MNLTEMALLRNRYNASDIVHVEFLEIRLGPVEFEGLQPFLDDGFGQTSFGTPITLDPSLPPNVVLVHIHAPEDPNSEPFWDRYIIPNRTVAAEYIPPGGSLILSPRLPNPPDWVPPVVQPYRPPSTQLRDRRGLAAKLVDIYDHASLDGHRQFTYVPTMVTEGDAVIEPGHQIGCLALDCPFSVLVSETEVATAGRFDLTDRYGWGAELEKARLQKDWDSLKEGLKLPRMTDDELRKFVDDFTSDRIFTSAQLREHEVKNMLTTIFLPIALGALAQYNPESLDTIGVIWEYMSAASPRAINGRPTFFSCRLMHKDDWERAKKAIIREEERRATIEV